MDVTLSELLATFMESPLVVWVSALERMHSHKKETEKAINVKL